MSVDQIRYDLLTMKALRGMVRDLLIGAAKNGLPGEHHFFIAFDTHAPGVRISPRLRAQYPQEMTVVLQHQFWDMTVTDDAFEVGLSFGGVPERLRVPFEAIRGFFDPSVEFGLQFQEKPEEAPADAQGAPAQPSPILRSVPQQESAETDAKDAKPAALNQDTAAPLPFAPVAGAADKNNDKERDKNSTGSDPDDGPDKPSGEVVRFDRFRKK
jgi:hypothetical protein